MSADDGSAQPPPAGTDKPQAPKAAATFSSFINKNTTGKKFAPKAARRRPAAAPTATAPPATTAQLPTPAATQEPAASTAEPTSTPAAPPTDSQAHPDRGHQDGVQAPATTGGALSVAEKEVAPRTDLNAPSARPATHEATLPAAEKEVTVQPTETEETPSARPTLAATISTTVESPVVAPEAETAPAQDPAQVNGETTDPLPTSAPWVAVNHPRDGVEEEAASTAAPPKKKRQPAKPRAKRGRKAVVESAAEDTVDGAAEGATGVPEEQGDVDGDSQQSPARQSAKSQGKRKATTASIEEGGEIQAPAKRTRRPRKAKGSTATELADTAEGEVDQELNDEVVTTTRRKSRQPKRKRSETTEGGDGEDGRPPKRKGRPPREPTPEDAEGQTIDPEITFMDGLASRNIRVGKLSNRERQMREIDWEAVRQRRREEDSRPIRSNEQQQAADRALNEAALNAQEELGPRYRLVNGNIELVPNSGTINRAADADREIAEYEVLETDDLTARTTSRSFMKNNKRFPNDFLLPGQGKKWNKDSTDLFYQGLKSFGTDFQMISRMFPGSTRRSIKLKFTREERENPGAVKEALQGDSEIATHWDVFLKAANMEEDSFADADEIKRQMAETEREMRERIDAARLETEERNRQKAAAGVLDDGEEEQAGDKENGKGRRKRREKGKQVTFQDEPGVEILGAIDEDDTWGKE